MSDPFQMTPDQASAITPERFRVLRTISAFRQCGCRDCLALAEAMEKENDVEPPRRPWRTRRRP